MLFNKHVWGEMICILRNRHVYDSARGYHYEYGVLHEDLPLFPGAYELRRQLIGTRLTCRCGREKFFWKD